MHHFNICKYALYYRMAHCSVWGGNPGTYDITHLFNLFWVAAPDMFLEEDMYILRRQKCIVLSTVCDAELSRELQTVLDSLRAEPLFHRVIGFPLTLHFSGEVGKKLGNTFYEAQRYKAL